MPDMLDHTDSAAAFRHANRRPAQQRQVSSAQHSRSGGTFLAFERAFGGVGADLEVGLCDQFVSWTFTIFDGGRYTGIQTVGRSVCSSTVRSRTSYGSGIRNSVDCPVLMSTR